MERSVVFASGYMKMSPLDSEWTSFSSRIDSDFLDTSVGSLIHLASLAERFVGSLHVLRAV